GGHEEMELVITALASSMAAVAKHLYPAIESYVRRRRADATVQIELDPKHAIKLDGLSGLSDEQLAELVGQLRDSVRKDVGTVGLTRQAAGHSLPEDRKPQRSDAAVFRLRWKWRERSAVKITERTREETTEALHRRREGRHPQATFAGTGTGLKAV